MTFRNLQRWEREFREAAEADEYAQMRDHLCRLELPGDPALLLAGTIQIVCACAAYPTLDGQSFAAFFKMQTYNPSEAVDATYALTFDLYGKAFGRVLVPTNAIIPDLADLYGHPWQDYRICGYRSIHISRIDGRKLGSMELARLEKEVTDDLRFDYCEEELDFWFDDATIEGMLLITVQDHEEG
jgi:hypothetical protein